jgi:cholesterol transport system auxiliary component
MKHHSFLRSPLPLLALVPLVSCASLLGGGKPDNLYRFGIPAGDVMIHAPGEAAQQQVIRLAHIRFAPEIEGDRILTARGDGVLYLKDARWVAAAPDLMVQAIVRRFDQRASTIRLTPASARTADGVQLRLAFDRFEARYDAVSGPNTPPTILVSGTAEMTDAAGAKSTGERSFSIKEKAAANSQAAIVAAFDQAVSQYTVELVDWTAQQSVAGQSKQN